MPSAASPRKGSPASACPCRRKSPAPARTGAWCRTPGACSTSTSAHGVIEFDGVAWRLIEMKKAWASSGPSLSTRTAGFTPPASGKVWLSGTGCQRSATPTALCCRTCQRTPGQFTDVWRTFITPSKVCSSRLRAVTCSAGPMTRSQVIRAPTRISRGGARRRPVLHDVARVGTERPGGGSIPRLAQDPGAGPRSVSGGPALRRAAAAHRDARQWPVPLQRRRSHAVCPPRWTASSSAAPSIVASSFPTVRSPSPRPRHRPRDHRPTGPARCPQSPGTMACARTRCTASWPTGRGRSG